MVTLELKEFENSKFYDFEEGDCVYYVNTYKVVKLTYVEHVDEILESNEDSYVYLDIKKAMIRRRYFFRREQGGIVEIWSDQFHLTYEEAVEELLKKYSSSFFENSCIVKVKATNNYFSSTVMTHSESENYYNNMKKQGFSEYFIIKNQKDLEQFYFIESIVFKRNKK